MPSKYEMPKAYLVIADPSKTHRALHLFNETQLQAAYAAGRVDAIAESPPALPPHTGMVDLKLDDVPLLRMHGRMSDELLKLAAQSHGSVGHVRDMGITHMHRSCSLVALNVQFDK